MGEGRRPGLSPPLLVLLGATVYGFLLGALAVALVWWLS